MQSPTYSVSEEAVSDSPASTPAAEPTQTFHPDRRSRGSFHFPHLQAVESIAGGAHFTAVTQNDATSPGGGRGHHRSPSGASQLESPMLIHQVTRDQPVVLEGERKRVFMDVQELFCCRPTKEIFQRSWKEDAVFEDPLSKCYGYEEYAPQWFSMPKIFPQSITKSANVISSTYGPIHENRIIYEQVQEYTFRFVGMKKVQTIKSTVIIDLDEDNKITKLEDKWEGADQPQRWGLYYLRRLHAKALPWVVKVPSKQ